MPVSDVEVWVDSNGDQTCDLKLNRPFGVTYRDGSWSTGRPHSD